MEKKSGYCQKSLTCSKDSTLRRCQEADGRVSGASSDFVAESSRDLSDPKDQNQETGGGNVGTEEECFLGHFPKLNMWNWDTSWPTRPPFSGSRHVGSGKWHEDMDEAWQKGKCLRRDLGIRFPVQLMRFAVR